MSYVFLQCVNELCRFRFPAMADEAGAMRCPRCHKPTKFTDVAKKGDPPSAYHLPERGRLVALLDNIRSIHNVGSMFRTADGAGISHLYLAGITATPDHHRLSKAALGAQNTVGWSYNPNAVDEAIALRAAGFELWALERLTGEDLPVNPFSGGPIERLAIVVGNEKAGVDPGVLTQCEGVITLPMVGQKSSLNAAVAFGIAVYSLQFGSSILLTD